MLQLPFGGEGFFVFKKNIQLSFACITTGFRRIQFHPSHLHWHVPENRGFKTAEDHSQSYLPLMISWTIYATAFGHRAEVVKKVAQQYTVVNYLPGYLMKTNLSTRRGTNLPLTK